MTRQAQLEHGKDLVAVRLAGGLGVARSMGALSRPFDLVGAFARFERS